MYTYDKSIAPQLNIPIVTGATAYDDPDTCQTFILVINEGLYYGSRLDHTLINPNQIQEYMGSRYGMTHLTRISQLA